jgi:hypothetical protein
MDHGSRLERDAAAAPADLRLPRELLVRVRHRLLLGEAPRGGEVGPADAQIAGRMIRHFSRRAAGVDVIPAAVVVAARHGRESGRQVERATDHRGA